MVKQFSLFVTIRFRSVDTIRIRTLVQTMTGYLTDPFHISYEQEGERIIKAPHVHVVILTDKKDDLVTKIRQLFRDVTTDIVALSKNKFLTWDLLHRYLQGFKKHTSRRMSELTDKWRQSMNLDTITKGAIVEAVRQTLTQDDLRKIDRRKDLYNRPR